MRHNARETFNDLQIAKMNVANTKINENALKSFDDNFFRVKLLRQIFRNNRK